jgi:hypothetical protein
MAKKIHNKNAREAHLMSEAYQRVYNEERITDVFYRYVDLIDQDIYNGMTFKESMISNEIDPSHWKDLLDIYTEYMEDKTEGPFETGFEDAEGKRYSQEREDNIDYARSKRYEDEEHSKSLTLNEEEINVVQEALTRLELESFSNDEFYNEEEVNRMLHIAKEILERSGVE